MQDVDTILHWENDPSLWEVTDQPGPFTRNQILQFILRSQDLDDDLQQRWMIIHAVHGPVGCIDLFEYDEELREVGIGITIALREHRRKGYAQSALVQMMDCLHKEFRLRKIHCLIHPTNTGSMQLFHNLGFQNAGERIHRGKHTLYYERKLD
ncbi:MAG: GNAT family N-acetyltransferase [Flavobacteriales bacterium]